MTYKIPDRKAVAQIVYQLRRFERQCSELPERTQAEVRAAIINLRSLLDAAEEEENKNGE